MFTCCVDMVTGYLVAYAAFRALFDHSPVMVPSKDILIFFLILAVELCPLILQFFVFNCPFIHSSHFALYYLDLVFVSYMNGF